MSSSPPFLRPMTAGDILDQAIQLYRKNFATLVGIVAVVTVPLLIISMIASLVLFSLDPVSTNDPEAGNVAIPLVLFGVGGLTTLLGAIAAPFQVGALAVVISERFLGRAVSLREAYSRVLRRWLSLLMAVILIGLVNVVLWMLAFVPFFGLLFASEANSNSAFSFLALCSCFLFIPALLLLFYLNVHWSFATQAIVLENQNSTGGLRRSWRLVHSSFWRVLGFTIILGLLVSLFSAGPIYLVGFTSLVLPSFALSSAVQNVVQSVIQVLLTPIQFAALTLMYYDLRIRKEGLDLQLMLQ